MNILKEITNPVSMSLCLQGETMVMPLPQRGCTDKCIMVLNRKWVQDNWLLVRIPDSITGLGSRLIGSAVCAQVAYIYSLVPRPPSEKSRNFSEGGLGTRLVYILDRLHIDSCLSEQKVASVIV